MQALGTISGVDALNFLMPFRKCLLRITDRPIRGRRRTCGCPICVRPSHVCPHVDYDEDYMQKARMAWIDVVGEIEIANEQNRPLPPGLVDLLSPEAIEARGLSSYPDGE